MGSIWQKNDSGRQHCGGGLCIPGFFLRAGFYTIPPERTKPFGTVHALLCAADVVHEPCCVINADDYYGIDASHHLSEAGETARGRQGHHGGLSFEEYRQPVSRGVCTVADGRLRSVREALKVQLNPDGALRALARDRPLAQDTAVSMNFWGFMPSIFPELKAYFENFLRHDAGGDLKAECLLPVMVDQQMREGKLDVSILHFSDKWFGMTYQQDREIVAAELQKLHERATTLRICKNRKKEPESQHPRQLPRVLF